MMLLSRLAMIASLVHLVAFIAFIVTAFDLLRTVSVSQRKLRSGLVFLSLVPVFNVGWNVYLVSRLNATVAAAGGRADAGFRGDLGYVWAVLYAVGMVLMVLSATAPGGVFPLAGILTSFVAIYALIRYVISLRRQRDQILAS